MTTGRTLLTGVIAPAVTPMTTPGRPSSDAASVFLAALRASGVDGLMLLGSNGEGPLLPASALGEFTSGVSRRWRQLGGGPVLVNITGAGTAEVFERAAAVVDAEPDALVLSPPIYFHHRDDEIISHYAVTASLGIPVIAYNVPRYSNPITPPVLDALLGMAHVVGLKDSSGDLEWLGHAIRISRERRPDFGISQGAEQLLADGLRLGADGILPGIANIAPRPSVDLYAAAGNGDDPGVDRAQELISRLCQIHSIRPGVPAIKEVLAWRGYGTAHVAPPLLPCTARERSALITYLTPFTDHLIEEAASEGTLDASHRGHHPHGGPDRRGTDNGDAAPAQ
jgi:4-hydroxy-tetrahydrodipicolinate synthase